MSGLFAAQLEIAHEVGIEEHHGFGGERAVLGCTEGENIDSRAPGDIPRMTTEEGHCVGKTGTVHLYLQAPIVREFANAVSSSGRYAVPNSVACDRASTVGCVVCTEAGCASSAAAEYVARYFAIRSLEQGKLRPAREEAGRAALRRSRCEPLRARRSTP